VTLASTARTWPYIWALRPCPATFPEVRFWVVCERRMRTVFSGMSRPMIRSRSTCTHLDVINTHDQRSSYHHVCARGFSSCHHRASRGQRLPCTTNTSFFCFLESCVVCCHMACVCDVCRRTPGGVCTDARSPPAWIHVHVDTWIHKVSDSLPTIFFYGCKVFFILW
jgi:hypothetical protein